MARSILFYARFMDDIVIMAPTQWKFRAAIETENRTLGELKLERHPDKTFIGRITRGFDFLGYAFTPSRLRVAPKTFERFVERMTRLCEQGAGTVRIGEYAWRWWRWVRGGVRDGVKVGVPGFMSKQYVQIQELPPFAIPLLSIEARSVVTPFF